MKVKVGAVGVVVGDVATGVGVALALPGVVGLLLVLTQAIAVQTSELNSSPHKIIFFISNSLFYKLTA
jgi:hypothetical protein